MLKLAVVIPSFQDASGLWFTVAAARVDLEADFAPDEYEIIAVVDGPEDDGKVIYGMRQMGTCRFLASELRSPQMNRDLGLRATEAPYVFFLDSHVIPSRGFFKRLLQTAEETSAAIVHGPHCFWKKHEKGLAYGYYFNWRDYFWACSAEDVPKFPDRPYPIAITGHGAMVVNREKYLKMGGYWGALKGWGGEEPQLNLKAWLLGEQVLMEPRVYHWHFMPEKRRLAEIFKSEPFVRNFMLVSYACGGESYLNSTYGFFTRSAKSYDTFDEALAHKDEGPFSAAFRAVPQEAEEERKLICSGPFHGDLDALRAYFNREGIPN